MTDAPTIRRGRALRCAVYTRKSSEEGLEQEFNSLHAQREACEAYIKSQRHEGWVCLAQRYDDGGLSGATMDRPALQQLLADIQASKVDAVVTYKVDRLTRSLADFAKIVEIFDAKGVSFVSVTQQFNTTTSMGRLTLNVLLSFAQFEREVTGERIRDKIAASKKKGMWMGGLPPLGYRCRDHKLTVVESEAETVQHNFRRYAALGSVRLLKEELDATGIRSKCRTSSTGRRWGGKPLARGALYLMLQNSIYRGRIVHKDQHYPGEHKPIIDEALWDAVEAKLAANAVERSSGKGTKKSKPARWTAVRWHRSTHDPDPCHQKGTRYRYYVSRPLISDARAHTPEGLRIPAGDIERLVVTGIGEFFSEHSILAELLSPHVRTAAQQRHLLQRAAEFAASWPGLSAMQQRPLLLGLSHRIVVRHDSVEIQLLPSRIATILQRASSSATSETSGAPHERPIVLSVPAQFRRVGLGIRMLIEGKALAGQASKADPKLVKLIARAHHFSNKLAESSSERLADLA